MTIEEQKYHLKNKASPEVIPLMLAEYNALRAEMLKRTELQHQLLSLALVAPSTILAFGYQAKNAFPILLYPILALFLAMAWASNDRRVRQMGAYIRGRVEAKVGEENIGWEHFSTATRIGHIGRFGTLNFWASRGIFLGTQLLTMFVGISLATFDINIKIALALAILSIILTIIVLRRAKVRKVDGAANTDIIAVR